MTTGALQMDNVSAGEVGGIVAGVLAALAAMGKGIAWIVNWDKASRDTKEDKLTKWEANLVSRERDYREEIEDRLKELKADLDKAKGIAEQLNTTVTTLVIAVEDLTSELESHAPNALSLKRARKLLQSLQLRPNPPDLAALAHKIDAANTIAADI